MAKDRWIIKALYAFFLCEAHEFDEAVELLRPLDRPETLVRLGELLSYTHFDPSPFPNLVRRLEAQGIMRREIEPMNFACRRDP